MKRKDIKKIQQYFGNNVTYENKGIYIELVCKINCLKSDEIWCLFKEFILEGYNNAQVEKRKRRNKIWKRIKN
jgi:hypothetical protein